MEQTQIFEKVKEVIVENLSCSAEDVKPEATLMDDLQADSLDAVEISMALEDAFDVEIPDEEFANMKTVQDIVTYLGEKAE